MGTSISPVNEHTWTTFVRPAVKLKHLPDTRAIITSIMPYFPRACVCIAGYLDDEDQFWKVDYHWELLMKMTGKIATGAVTAAQAAQVADIRRRLSANSPRPASGYLASKTVGFPVDQSGHDKIRLRWETLKVAKVEFGTILASSQLKATYPPAEAWDLAVAPVMSPGTSKHGSGYALDVHGLGLNVKIKAICHGLGASLTFDEKFHVHVEFKHGVRVPA